MIRTGIKFRDTEAARRGGLCSNRMVDYEAEVIPGIEPIAIHELHSLAGAAVQSVRQTRPGFIRFRLESAPEKLALLRSVVAVYHIHGFAIPRPKALLGHQHFTRLIDILQGVIARWKDGNLSLGIGAAGSESSVLLRLKRELAAALGVAPAEVGKGDLYIRLARRRDKKDWEILVRTTARPLSKRGWRAANMPGALNATVAYAMTQFNPTEHPATVVNLCSGTSTILIEHALTRPADLLLGVDHADRMIEAAARNTAASQTADRIHHIKAEASQTPLLSSSADRIYADLPFGHHVGSHEANQRLYPRILDEAARLAKNNANLALLTHDIHLLRRCLHRSPWKIKLETRINLGGLHPRIFVLEQKSDRM